MSQPRVTVTFGLNGQVQQGQRRATVSRDMYSDQLNGGVGSNNRKRSVRDRLGGLQQQQLSTFNRAQKRPRVEEGGKWKHDLYDEKEDMGLRQQNGQDLRSRLNRRSMARGGQGDISSTGVKDLREKLSGPISAPQVTRETALQRRLASVVRGSSGIPSLAGVRAGVTRNSPISQKAPMLQKAPVHKPQSVEVDENTIAGLLQSLGLSKYLITFQAEEVDMAALRHMGDDDLKELGVPMGPRKKILLAVASHA